MDPRERFQEAATRWLPAIEKQLSTVTMEETPSGSTLPGMCGWHLSTGGKRIRALLPLMTADALGADPAPLVPFGAACEMLHNATLVHDDLQDGDRTRRGAPTAWVRYGVPQAINLGDAMFYYALLLLGRVGASPDVILQVSRRMLRDTIRVIDGQEREFALKASPRVSMSAYITMVEGKTSGLFALPMAGAAMFTAASSGEVQRLEEAAMHMGVIFQVQDDILDLYGAKGRTAPGGDICEGKRSVLAVHCLERGSPEDASWLTGVLDSPREETTAEDVARAARLFRESGPLDHALALLEERRGEVAAALRGQPRLQELALHLCDVFLDPIEEVLGAQR